MLNLTTTATTMIGRTAAAENVRNLFLSLVSEVIAVTIVTIVIVILMTVTVCMCVCVCSLCLVFAVVCSCAAKKLKRTGSQKKKNTKKFGKFLSLLPSVRVYCK